VASSSRLVAGSAGSNLELIPINPSGLLKHVRFSGLISSRWPVVCGALLVAALGWAAWQALRQTRDTEPLYRGKPLSSWLFEQEGDEAVRQAGTNAIPTLLRLLRARDSALKIKVMDLVRRQHLINVRYTPADIRNAMGATGFWSLGPSAQTAVPALIEIADQGISSRSRYEAIYSLAGIRRPAKEAVPSLLRWATNADQTVQYGARFALFRIDPEAATKAGLKPPPLAQGSIAQLISQLETNRSPNIRIGAAGMLEDFARGDQSVIVAMTEALKDQDAGVRSAATNALLKIDPDAAAEAHSRQPNPCDAGA
jgi:HEAT repeat protein